MTEFPYQFQANFKFGPQYKEALVNVPAQSPEELLSKLEWLTANAAAFVAAQTALLGVEEVAPLAANVQSVQVQQEPQAPAPQQNGGWGAPQQQGPPQFSQPAQAQVAQETITDKWGVRWEYGRPDAPATPRGPAVAKHATSQAGKAYSRWEDPAAGPKWFQERQPKIEKSQQWQGSFINTRG